MLFYASALCGVEGAAWYNVRMSWVRNILTTCQTCGTLFETSKKEQERGRGRYCSLSCAATVAARHRDQTGSKNQKWKGGIDKAAKGRRYRSRYSDKEFAHRAVRRAVARGDMKPSACFGCGARKTEAHHPDYSKPLMVIWLCKSCHLRVHEGERLLKARLAT